MRIGEVAKNAGVGVETVRFYERRGLISQPPKPETGGFRSYPPEAVDQIRFARQAQVLGFSLAEVRDLLSLRANVATDCADVRARAQAKLNEVNAKMSHLAAIQSTLKQLIRSCPGRGLASRDCSILEALEPHTAEKRKSNH